MLNSLWNKDVEKNFFKDALKISTPEQLFYKIKENTYFAYWPKNYKGPKTTLQSRNSFIGSFTEKWTKNLLQSIINELKLFAVHKVICKELGLTAQSPADIAICKTNDTVQKAENILLIIEIKMSIVWNWHYNPLTHKLKEIGDFTEHSGVPSLLRSDSMLKAIGKSINIRTLNVKSSSIPILIIGNTPIKQSYFDKVDQLKKAGIIQGFFSLNPNPLNKENHLINIKQTPYGGFKRIDDLEELKKEIKNLIEIRKEFFSAMLTKENLGKIINIANKEKNLEAKAEKFLKLINDVRYN